MVAATNRESHTPKDIPQGRSFRLTCKESEIEAIESLLAEEGFISSPVPFSKFTRILVHEPKPLGQSVAAQFGLIYIQDKSSMLPPLYLHPDSGSVVLDMCASPGGKTGMLSQCVGDSGLIVANEPQNRRLQTLRSTIQRHNLFNVITTCFPGESFPGDQGLFEAILLDVPCSGWGTVDKHPKVLDLWTEERIGCLLDLQKKLLIKANQLLAPGGLLLYSTCTTNRCENEEQIEWILENSNLFAHELEPKPGFFWKPAKTATSLGCLEVDGPPSQAQSFFLACLQKPRDYEDTNKDVLNGRSGSFLSKSDMQRFEEVRLPSALRNRLPPGEVVRFKKQVVFCPQKALYGLPQEILWRGFLLGHIHKQHIRLSSRLRYLLPPAQSPDSFVVTEVAVLQRLLSGQSLSVSTKANALALYWQDVPLGWLSVKGKRCLWTGSEIPLRMKEASER